jgi:uncharacterized membrane protein
MAKLERSSNKEILEGKVIAVLSYLSILCILPLIFKRDNHFVLFHGKQGFVIFLGQVAAFVLHTIPIFQWVWQFSIFIFGVISFLGILAVLKGQYLKIPVISDLADKITL